jgi:hypothetical protein
LPVDGEEEAAQGLLETNHWKRLLNSRDSPEKSGGMNGSIHKYQLLVWRNSTRAWSTWGNRRRHFPRTSLRGVRPRDGGYPPPNKELFTSQKRFHSCLGCETQGISENL